MRIFWQIAALEIAGLSTQSCIAFGTTGHAAVAYHSSEHNALRFARQTDGPLWDISTVDRASSDCKPSLAFRMNQPAISYRVGSRDGGELKYALYKGGSEGWEIEAVAPSADASSLAFDPSHHPAISFYDPTDKNLKLARRSGPANWIVESVADFGDVGSFNSLSFTPLTAEPASKAGQPGIAFYDSTERKLRYALLVLGSWSHGGPGIQMAQGPGVGRCRLAHTFSGQAKIVVSQPGRITALSDGSTSGWYTEASLRGATTGWIANNPARVAERGVSCELDGAARYSLGFSYARLGRFLIEAPGKTQVGELIGPFELTSTAISQSGKPAVSYYDISNRTIKVAIGTVTRTPIDYLADLWGGLFDLVQRILRRSN